MDVLSHRCGRDLTGGEPDPVIDDLEADVAGPYRNLFSAIRVSIEPWLTHEKAQSRPKRLAGVPDASAHRGQPFAACPGEGCRAEPGRRAIVAEDLAQPVRPLPRRHSGSGTGKSRSHEVFRAFGGCPQAVERRENRVPVPLPPPGTGRLGGLNLDLGIDRLDRPLEVGDERARL